MPLFELELELAVEAGADFIVTHNLRDFGEAEGFGIRVVAPRDYLEIARKVKQETKR